MKFITLILFSITVSLASFAQEPGLLSNSSLDGEKLLDKASLTNPYQGWLVAQSDNSDAYDPFVDFSEFEEVTEEEADINFFRNGRFFTLGFAGGYRQFTGNLNRMYQNSAYYGLYLGYFFDLRFALQLSFTTGSHTINFTTPGGTSIRGAASVSNVGLDLKYYFNTQNVTRGLAQLNPYVIAGFNQMSRTATVSGESAFAKETATPLDIGVGIEIPMLRNKMYFGLQANYFLVNFADENTEIVVAGGAEKTGIFPSGDILNLSFVLGINF